MSLVTGGLLGKLFRANFIGPLAILPQYEAMQKREYAARKGTREKAKKKKVKVEVKKVEFVPHNLRGLDKLKENMKSKRSVDTGVEDPGTDNVYVSKYYKIPKFLIKEAITFHQETHHPTIYNVPNALVYVDIELNMVAEKKTRFVDSFNRTTLLPYPFQHGQERQVLVFCKTPEMTTLALEAGADLVGGSELIKQIQNGEIALADFKYVLSHPNILGELVVLRGLMKRKFPIAKNNTLTSDLGQMVATYKRGLEYRVEKDLNEHDLGTVKVALGPLDMPLDQLEANFEAILKDIELVRPKREGPFITWVWCTSPPSQEKFRVDFQYHLNKKDGEAPEQQRLLEVNQ